MHTKPVPNRSRFEDERRRFPLTFDIAKRTDALYLQEGRNDTAWAVQAVMDNRSLRCVQAEVFPCSASVTQRYFAVPDYPQTLKRALDEVDSFYSSRIQSVPVLGADDAATLCAATVTATPDKAARLLDWLVHRVTARLFYQERLPGLFITGEHSNRSFSHKSPHKLSSAPMTASVRRMVHRPNAYQLEQVRTGGSVIDFRTMRRVAEGLNYHALTPRVA